LQCGRQSSLYKHDREVLLKSSRSQATTPEIGEEILGTSLPTKFYLFYLVKVRCLNIYISLLNQFSVEIWKPCLKVSCRIITKKYIDKYISLGVSIQAYIFQNVIFNINGLHSVKPYLFFTHFSGSYVLTPNMPLI